MIPKDWLQLTDDELMTKSAGLRERHFGRSVQLCAIVNIRSGQCDMDCAFCSQNRRATIAAAKLAPDAVIIDRIHALADQGLERIGLVSSGGILPRRDFSHICDLIAGLKTDIRHKLCCSFGRLPEAELKTLKNLGIRRYHHNLETSPRFYPQLCTTQLWSQRRDTVKTALAIGMEVCSGALFGLGETWNDRIDLATELRKLEIKQIPLNFLHPQANTRFANNTPLGAEEALRIIALYRMLLPDATLRVCGGRPVTFGARQKEIFAAGANALITGNYLTTCGEALAKDLTMLAELGLDYPPARFRQEH